MKKQDNQTEYVVDDRCATPEYLDRIRNMTPEEFERHIKKLKEEEK